MAILTLKVKGQTLTVESEIDRIVENSVNYLDFKIICDDENWEDLATKVIVTYDKKAWEAFTIIPSETIHSPGFTISVIGYRSPGINSDDDLGEIVTTYPVAVKVFPSGATNGSDPEDTAIDFSTADELNAKITEINSSLSSTIEGLDEKIEENTLKITDVIIDSNIDPTEKHQVYSAEVILEVVAELVNMMNERELAGHKLTEYTEEPEDYNYYSAKTVNNMLEDLKTEIQGDLDEISDLVGQSLVEQLYNFYGASREDYPYVFLTYTNDLVMNLNFVSTFTEKGNGGLLIGEYPKSRLYGAAYSTDVNLKNLDTTPEFMVKYCMEVISSVEEKKTSQNSGAGGDATLYTNAVLEETYEDGSVYYIE